MKCWLDPAVSLIRRRGGSVGCTAHRQLYDVLLKEVDD